MGRSAIKKTLQLILRPRAAMARRAEGRSGNLIDRGSAAVRAGDETAFDPKSSFFVLGAGRSGTTSTIRILGAADNCEWVSEPKPRLREQTQRYRLGQLADPRPLLLQAHAERIRMAAGQGRISGIKDQQLYLWIDYLAELFRSRFVFVQRDGRDAVRSMLDVHALINGNLYQEAGGLETLPAEVLERRRRLAAKPEALAMERSRPRPLPGDPWHDRWPTLSRLQMAAWYWCHYNRTTLSRLHRLPPGRWRQIDYSTTPKAEQFADLYAWLGLSGFSARAIGDLLGSPINSMDEKRVSGAPRHPAWPDWPDDLRHQFDVVAARTMAELGYYPFSSLDFRAGEDEILSAPLPRFETSASLASAMGRHLAEEAGQLQAAWRSCLMIGHPVSLPDRPDDPPVAAGRLGEVPDGPRNGRFDCVIAAGLIDHAADMDRMLACLAARAEGTLCLIADATHRPDALEHDYRAGGPHLWSAAASCNLLRNQLGFKRTRLFTVATGEQARPMLDALIATRD